MLLREELTVRSSIFRVKAESILLISGELLIILHWLASILRRMQIRHDLFINSCNKSFDHMIRFEIGIEPTTANSSLARFCVGVRLESNVAD